VIQSLSSIGFIDYSGALNIRLKVWSVAHYATSEENKTTLLIDILYNQLKCDVQSTKTSTTAFQKWSQDQDQVVVGGLCGVICLEETFSVSICCCFWLRRLHWRDLSSGKQKDWSDHSRVNIKGRIVTSNYSLDS
jgi:hypothetical protein